MIDGQRVAFVGSGETDDLRTTMERAIAAGALSLMILASEGDCWQAEELTPLLRSLPVPVFGGVFPSIIFEARRHSRGTLVLGLTQTLQVAAVTGLSRKSGLEPQLQELGALFEGAKSLITLVDGLSANLESFVESLYGMTGMHKPVVGGGAGNLDFVQRPCLFSNHGMLEDAALLIALPFAIASGNAHGWQKLAGPFLVTRSHANVLEELNYVPAFDIYRQEVEAHSGRKFSDSDFFSISKTYPLGIESVDGDILVRDPIRQVGDSLICVGEVPQNATVHLLEGAADALIASAGEAATKAVADHERRANPDAQAASGALVLDCISRALFLDEAFAAELDAIHAALPGTVAVVGALTLGEIASSRGGLIELMNKSTVIAVL